MAEEAALSRSSFPQSSSGLFDVITELLLAEYRVRMISSRSSAACSGIFFRRNRSSMTSRSASANSLLTFFFRLSSDASKRSSKKVWASRYMTL